MFWLDKLFGKSSIKFNVGDKVILKDSLQQLSVKHPNPTVWEINDVYHNGGYTLKHGNPGRCVSLVGIYWDSELKLYEE